MQIEYKPNRLTSTGLANGLEDFCLFRIAGKFGAQISEAELSVLVQVKHPSSAPEASAALPDVISVTFLRHQCSFKPLWASTALFANIFFYQTDVPLPISPTTRSLAAVFFLCLSSMVG
jgi:hypothetical protein